MKAIVVTDKAGVKLVERLELQGGRRSPTSRARIAAISVSRFMRRDALGKNQSKSVCQNSSTCNSSRDTT